MHKKRESHFWPCLQSCQLILVYKITEHQTLFSRCRLLWTSHILRCPVVGNSISTVHAPNKKRNAGRTRAFWFTPDVLPDDFSLRCYLKDPTGSTLGHQDISIREALCAADEKAIEKPFVSTVFSITVRVSCRIGLRILPDDIQGHWIELDNPVGWNPKPSPGEYGQCSQAFMG